MPYDPGADEFAVTGGRRVLARAIDAVVGPYREFVETRAGLGETPERSATSADVVVFTFSMSDFLPAGADPDEIDAWDLERSERVEAIEGRHGALDRSTTTVFAVYGGRDACRVAGVDPSAGGLNDDAVVDMLETHAFDVRPSAIVVLDAMGGSDLVTGADALRSRIDDRES